MRLIYLPPMVDTQKNAEEQLQDERYDRTIRTLTAEVALKIMKSRVAVGPMTGVCTEFMKNVVLDGANVTIFDSEPILDLDVETNFMISEADKAENKSRAQALKDKFKEMNPYSDIQIEDTLNIGDAYREIVENKKEDHKLKEFTALVFSTTSFKEMI